MATEKKLSRLTNREFTEIKGYLFDRESPNYEIGQRIIEEICLADCLKAEIERLKKENIALKRCAIPSSGHYS